MADSPFIIELKQELARSRFNHYTDNYDTIQLGPEPTTRIAPVWRQCAGEFKRRLIELARTVLNPLRPLLRPVKRLLYYYLAPSRYFAMSANEYGDISFLHNLVGNQTSRDLVVKLFAYRILGYRKVKLPRNNPGYWKDIENVDQYRTDAESIPTKFMNIVLSLYDFTPLGFNLKTYATAPGSACAFVQKQYEYHHGHVNCKAETGDIAIDAGGCWGETTLYFAHEVGPTGKVVSFEFIPSNLAIMHRNIETNPELAKRIILVEQPIWDYSGLKLFYVDWGPGSRVTADEKQYQYDGTCNTISIDDMVAQQKLPRVDFIKMDIEGAEFPALRGAEKTIRAFRPKLAISLYHQISDFVTIPRWLYELDLGYDFYVDHHTIYQNETVLFAVPRAQAKAQPLPEQSAQAA